MDFSAILATVFLILSCISSWSEGLLIVNGNDPGKCNQTIHGKDVLVQDRENNELIIFCTKKNDVYKWTTIGGKTPIGELFSPAYDCSKILDHNPEAKDGMYWIDLGGTYPKQAYCDMITDGGGYMLFGRTNTSVTWTVPSSNDAVEPYGNPHWASHLGDAPILDLRIQMARTEDLSKPLAHWSFRLQTERLLKNLMIVDHGCAQATPGIGNIAYVKDLLTENIVTTKFRCSVFGGYHNPATGFGWVMKKLLNQLEREKTELKQIIENMNETLNNLLSIVKDPRFSESDILSGELYYDHLLKSWIGGIFTAKLCWRATRDGWAASTFHSKCDYKTTTVTLIKVGSYIFGAYATAYWGGSSRSYKSSSNAFIFSFVNKDNLPPFKSPVKHQGYAIYTRTDYGPTFGGSHDIHIANNANANTGSYINFGYSYQAPSGYSYDSTKARNLLAGTYIFTPDEVETFYLIN